MSGIDTQNPFAPPRALVEDTIDAPLGLVQATRGARFVAVVIDTLAFGCFGVVAAIALPAYNGYQQRAAAAGAGARLDVGHAAVAFVIALLIVGCMLAVIVYGAVLVYRHGQTIGKRMMGIRVVRTDGSRVAFGRFIFLRWLPITALGLIPFLGYVVTLLDSLLIFRENHLCLHDNIAGTRVVTAASSERATLRGAAGAGLRNAGA